MWLSRIRLLELLIFLGWRRGTMVAPQLAILKVEGSTPCWGITSFGNDEQHNNACVVFLVRHRQNM